MLDQTVPTASLSPPPELDPQSSHSLNAAFQDPSIVSIGRSKPIFQAPDDHSGSSTVTLGAGISPFPMPQFHAQHSMPPGFFPGFSRDNFSGEFLPPIADPSMLGHAFPVFSSIPIDNPRVAVLGSPIGSPQADHAATPPSPPRSPASLADGADSDVSIQTHLGSETDGGLVAVSQPGNPGFVAWSPYPMMSAWPHFVPAAAAFPLAHPTHPLPGAHPDYVVPVSSQPIFHSPAGTPFVGHILPPVMAPDSAPFPINPQLVPTPFGGFYESIPYVNEEHKHPPAPRTSRLPVTLKDPNTGRLVAVFVGGAALEPENTDVMDDE
ncbi:uncharacterized protein BJ171DRAFT_578016 [Polychytrium aggregatum]|uniref:uncharacterized protein n=1 Tax=Polychytrium aggregatum TaxID=110093 RepID=UPI0022FE6C25|nr:uncharacterized protein BJ171DRAFT_578016 [Polychytrium aggregatum]KAI9208202.1 hypothetical protein BJ171DRAFT_578016 [Polychytrium aggregatum]